MHTARGSGEFLVYEATVNFIKRSHTIPIVAGAEINEVLLGLKWLENHKLVVDKRNNILTFES